MANMIVGLRVMPEDGEVEYEALESEVREVVENYDESVEIRSIEGEPVGFGLKAVSLEIEVDENCGTEELENKLNDLEAVGEASITKMDRL